MNIAHVANVKTRSALPGFSIIGGGVVAYIGGFILGCKLTVLVAAAVGWEWAVGCIVVGAALIALGAFSGNKGE